MAVIDKLVNVEGLKTVYKKLDILSSNNYEETSTKIEYETDLNTLTTPGIYMANTSAYVVGGNGHGPLINCPVSENFRMIVSNLTYYTSTSRSIIQIIFERPSNEIWTRVCSTVDGNGSSPLTTPKWTNWTQISKTGFFPFTCPDASGRFTPTMYKAFRFRFDSYNNTRTYYLNQFGRNKAQSSYDHTWYVTLMDDEGFSYALLNTPSVSKLGYLNGQYDPEIDEPVTDFDFEATGSKTVDGTKIYGDTISGSFHVDWSAFTTTETDENEQTVVLKSYSQNAVKTKIDPVVFYISDAINKAISDVENEIDALEEQVADNNTILYTDPKQLNYTIGKSLNTTTTNKGKDLTNTNYINTKYYIYALAGSWVGLKDYTNYKYQVAKYETPDAESCYSVKGVTASATDKYIITEDCYIRFAIRPATDAVQTDDSLKNYLDIHILSKDVNTEVAGLSERINKNETDISTINDTMSGVSFMRGFGTTTTGDNYLNSFPVDENDPTNTNPDINNAELNRIYFLNTIPAAMKNLPEDESKPFSGMLVTFAGYKTGNQTRTQLLFSRAGRVWLRSQWAGNWDSWTSIYDDRFNNEKYYLNTCVDKTKTKLTSGDTIITFGDSITASTNGWPVKLADITDTTLARKAKAGTGFSHAAADDDTVNYPYGVCMIDLVNSSDITNSNWANAKLIFVAAGINDASFFNKNDRDGSETHTLTFPEFEDDVQDFIDAVKAKLTANNNSDAHIVFITPIRLGNASGTIYKRLNIVSGIICYLALTNGCSVINGFDFPIPVTDVEPYDDNGTTKYLIERQTAIDSDTNEKDHLHPNSIGHEIYARSVVNAIM